MPWDAEHKEQTRERIVDAAARLFTQEGFDRVTIDDVMREASLTRGAFYAHFKNKAELYQCAIIAGAKQAKRILAMAGERDVSKIAEHYLAIGDAEHHDIYCPLAFFVTDMTQRDEAIRDTYTRALAGYIELLQGMQLPAARARQAAVMMIGGLALARATTDSNLKRQLLNDCLAGVRDLVALSSATS